MLLIAIEKSIKKGPEISGPFFIDIPSIPLFKSIIRQ